MPAAEVYAPIKEYEYSLNFLWNLFFPGDVPAGVDIVFACHVAGEGNACNTPHVYTNGGSDLGAMSEIPGARVSIAGGAGGGEISLWRYRTATGTERQVSASTTAGSVIGGIATAWSGLAAAAPAVYSEDAGGASGTTATTGASAGSAGVGSVVFAAFGFTGVPIPTGFSNGFALYGTVNERMTLAKRTVAGAGVQSTVETNSNALVGGGVLAGFELAAAGLVVPIAMRHRQLMGVS